MSKITKWRLNPVWHGMLYSCIHMATVGVKGLTNRSTQSTSLQRRSSQPIVWPILTNKTVQENTQYNSTKANNTKFSKTKYTLVQSSLTTLGQKTRWAYSTTLLNPHFNFTIINSSTAAFVFKHQLYNTICCDGFSSYRFKLKNWDYFIVCSKALSYAAMLLNSMHSIN